jgi:hypothetical protein
VTIRADEVPQSQESEWQESVVRHLGLTDWIRLQIDDELDVVGPYARRGLERHGLLWPFNAHFHSPMLEAAAGGVLLTGIGGDELWSSVFARPVSLRRRAVQLVPRSIRRAVLARRMPVDYPWLTARARREAQLAAVGGAAAPPRTTLGRMAQYRGMRYATTGNASLELLAADAGAEIMHPLFDARVWSAVAATAPSAGFARPDESLRAMAGHLLPEDLLSRSTKASFDAVFFNEHSRAFVERWTGAGAPSELVDADALHGHWRGEAPDPHSLTLIQSAWLESVRDRLDEPSCRVVQ